MLVFVDSDSYLDTDAVTAIVQPFADDRVGAVVGHAEVKNASANWMTKVQQVRYFSAFRVIKGPEPDAVRDRDRRIGLLRRLPPQHRSSPFRRLAVPDLPRPTGDLRRRPGAH